MASILKTNSKKYIIDYILNTHPDFATKESEQKNIQFNYKKSSTKCFGRNEDIQNLHRILHQQNIITVSGRLSVGKTEFVKSYFEEYKNYYNGNIIWINCQNIDVIKQTMMDLAVRLNVMIYRDEVHRSLQSIIKDIYNCIENCLIVYDDVESFEEINQFLPPKTNNNKIKTVITSKNTKWNINQTLYLNVISTQNAIKLLKFNLNYSNKYCFTKLADVLENLPLNLELIKKYIDYKINVLKEDFKISEYITKFENSCNVTQKILEIIVRVIVRTTKFSDVCIKILNYSSYFSSENIPKDVFLQLHNKEILKESFDILKTFSLIKDSMLDENFYCINIEIQQIIRLVLKSLGIHKSILKTALKLVISNENLIKSIHTSFVLKYIILDNDFDFYFRSNNQTNLIFSAVYNNNTNIFKYLVGSIKKTDLFHCLQIAIERSILEVIKFIWENQNFQQYLDEFLLKSVQCNNLVVVKYFVKNGANINYVNKQGLSPLFVAVINNNDSITKFLLKLKSDTSRIQFSVYSAAVFERNLPILKLLLDNCNINLEILLHLASKIGDYQIVKYLVENNCDINFVDKQGCTALFYATKNNHETIVKYLLENNCFINQIVEGKSVLDVALENNYKIVSKYLIDSGGSILIIKKEGIMFLHLALVGFYEEIYRFLNEKRLYSNSIFMHFIIKHNYIKILKYLVEKKVDCNVKDEEGFTILHVAAEFGRLNIIKYLNKLGFCNNVLSNQKFSLLHVACETGQENIVKYLVENKSDVNVLNEKEFSPLHSAIESGFDRICRYLVENNADVNVLSSEGFSPVYVAVLNNRLSIVKYLIEVNCDIFLVNNLGYSCLHVASFKGDVNMVELLIEKGLQVNLLSNDSYTPLHMACIKGHLQVVKYLIEHGADLNILTNTSSSALHFAASNGREEVFKYLHEQGSELRVLDQDGFTPLCLAIRNGHDPIVSYIKNNLKKIRQSAFNYFEQSFETIPSIICKEDCRNSKQNDDEMLGELKNDVIVRKCDLNHLDRNDCQKKTEKEDFCFICCIL